MRMIFFGYKNDTSGPAFRGIISSMEVVFQESVGETDGLSVMGKTCILMPRFFMRS